MKRANKLKRIRVIILFTMFFYRSLIVNEMNTKLTLTIEQKNY